MLSDKKICKVTYVTGLLEVPEHLPAVLPNSAASDSFSPEREESQTRDVSQDVLATVLPPKVGCHRKTGI